MQAPTRSKMSKGLPIIAFVLGVLVFGYWRALQPKIQIASEAEIRSVLPPELLLEPPLDMPAKQRFKQLVTLASSLDLRAVAQLGMSRSRPVARLETSRQIWQAHPNLLSDLSKLLKPGSIQYPAYHMGDMAETSAFTWLKTLSRFLRESAQFRAEQGDFQACVQMIGLDVRLSDQLRASDGPLITYQVATGLGSDISRAIATLASTRGFPASACKLLLDVLPPSPNPDEDLAKGIRSDFLSFSYKVLPDPTKSIASILSGSPSDQSLRARDVPVGTYDAFETAKEMGATVQTEMNNARHPLSQFDRSPLNRIKKELTGLPIGVDQGKPDGFAKSWDTLKYRVAMNNTENSIGRQVLASDAVTTSTDVEESDRWRGYRDLVRILLASRVYRADHGGMLPDSASDLVPLLGTWPTDPFNGKPMIYTPKKEVVYSVGKNLLDDGGQIGEFRESKDLGISLK